MISAKEIGIKIVSFAVQCRRVWQVIRKPTADEYKTIAKVSAIGILALGAIGFIIADLIRLFRG